VNAALGGNIDEIGIWRTQLDEDAILALYNSGDGRFYDRPPVLQIPNAWIISEGTSPLLDPKRVEPNDTFIRMVETQQPLLSPGFVLGESLNPQIHMKTPAANCEMAMVVTVPTLTRKFLLGAPSRSRINSVTTMPTLTLTPNVAVLPRNATIFYTD
jgi:hypothetical protein